VAKNQSVASVIRRWAEHDVRYLPGVTEDELLAFESRYDLKLPDDVRCFYETTNGTHVPLSAFQDHESYDFYPLSEVVPDEDYDWAMVFADYRELSWWYGIDLTGRGGHGIGTVYFLGSTRRVPLVVAHSFTEFLDLYVRDDPRIWPRGAAAYHDAFLHERHERRDG
jgi:hypothetical protein